MQIQLGQTVTLGWNGAKRLGDTHLCDSKMRVEAVGKDWVVLRRMRDGMAASDVFEDMTHAQILRLLES